jgi:hypothetical protein
VDPDPHQMRRRIPDPHQCEKSDPDPHRSKKPDPDPHQSDEDPQQCMPVREPNEVAVYASCNKMRIERTSVSDPNISIPGKKIPGSGSASKNLSILTQKIVSKLSEI